jgi:hypothetical protein
MFKVNNVVITKNKMPAVILEVYESGFSYLVAEVPKLSQEEVDELLRESDNPVVKAVVAVYNIDELRIPTEQEAIGLQQMFDTGGFMPAIN